MANLTVSSAFPSDFHNAVAQAADRWLRAQSEAERNTPPGPWLEFCGGWGAVEIRYQACCEHGPGLQRCDKEGLFAYGPVCPRAGTVWILYDRLGRTRELLLCIIR